MLEKKKNFAAPNKEALVQELEVSGYYTFDISSLEHRDEFLEHLSGALKEEVFARWHPLKPTSRSEASPVSYSGIFGLDEFPFHTDLANWRRPPRYLVLIAERGSSEVSTLLIDSNELVNRIGHRKFTRALVHPRRPIQGKLPLMRILEAANEDAPIFRWDEVFLKPASDAGKVGFKALKSAIDQQHPQVLYLMNKGHGIVIDNWRMLHGRSAVQEREQERMIYRAYLGKTE